MSPQILRAEFNSDPATAYAIRDHAQIAVNALLDPTEENASALFRIGAEAVAVAASLAAERRTET